MKLIPNWAILLISVAVFGIAFGGTYYAGKSAGKDEVELRVAKERVVSLEESAVREIELRKNLELERGRLRDVSQKLQEALSSKDVIYVDVVRNIVKEIEKPVYRSCALPPSGVQVISDAAEQYNATRQP